MVNSFASFWKGDVTLYVYYEGTKPQIEYPNVVYHDLLAVSPEQGVFKAKHANDPVANGWPNSEMIEGGVERKGNMKPKWETGNSYLWNSVRFSHKIFSQAHAARTVAADVMFWFDGDTLTLKPVTEADANTFLPEGSFCSYLGRVTYSECGFIGYDMKNPHFQEFMKRMEDMYISGSIYDLHQWTDCHVFDKVREEMEAEGKITNHNLNRKDVRGHPFVNSVLGDFIDHLKGRRKDVGKSFERDYVL